MDSEHSQYGTLYLSATPIGNLEDMTYRSVRILSEADLIAAEDTRHTRKLLAHYDIHTRLTSYHEHNKLAKGPELIGYLLSGKNLVCVSDAGLPGVADPGSHLAQLAIEAGIRVTPLPGANAALSALICSGLDTTMFSFIGFLPKTGKKRMELLEQIRCRKDTLIFYEAPHHLRQTLQDLASVLGEGRRAAAARELTKHYEEFRRGSLGELCAWYREHEPRGEFVLIVEGDAGEAGAAKDMLPQDPAEIYEAFLSQNVEKKEAMRRTAKQLGISRRDVYRILLEKESGEQSSKAGKDISERE